MMTFDNSDTAPSGATSEAGAKPYAGISKEGQDTYRKSCLVHQKPLAKIQSTIDGYAGTTAAMRMTPTAAAASAQKAPKRFGLPCVVPQHLSECVQAFENLAQAI